MNIFEGSDVGLRCEICKMILKEAIQTSRGFKACYTCYKEAKRHTNICPIDKEPASRIFIDKYTRKQIDQLKVTCSSKQYGCKWVGLLKEFENHLMDECEFKPPERQPEPLSHPFVFNGKCPWDCGQLVTKETLCKHVAKCVSITSAKCCPFLPFGCDYNGYPTLSEHLQVNNVNHTRMLACNVIINPVDLTAKEEAERREMVNRMNKEITFLNKKMEMMERKFNEELTSLRNVFENCSYTVEEINGTKKDNEDKFNMLRARCDSIHSCLSDLDLRQLLLENVNYDGHLIWKIDNFQNKMGDAMSGKVNALHSPPCCSKKVGYKFCARLYLNGDGMGKDTHISIFFVLMKSQYDDLLEWPFQHKVVFKLLKPSNMTESHCESFKPTSNLASFKKPVNEMNVASGCPLFMSKDRLYEFVKNDVIYIEMFVENQG